ncbi:MAG: hypothetical protein MPW15_07000 [Candidatus Manganitrophus sp.]|nr:hypothetical protein [Candidatus Manganitrophus sp.]
MRIRQLMTLGTLGIFLLAGTAFGQATADITTNTLSTTVGSTQFGFTITPQQLQTVMQSANALTCGPRTGLVMDCTLDNYVKAVGMPGSFTGNPNKIVWDEADFGCGSVCLTNGGPDPQTAPNFDGPNTLVGNITSNVDLGLGTATGDPFHSAGHIRFTLNPDPTSMVATIDQQIVQEINNANGLTMHFTQTDATGPNGFIASAASGPPLEVALTFPGPVNLTSSMQLTQTGDSGIPTATPFELNVTVAFPYGRPWNQQVSGFTGSDVPPERAFQTPGLNTSATNGDQFPVFLPDL